MEWTLEQAEEMRIGRRTYGDKHKGGALTWIRTGQETGGEYSLLYGELGPGYWIFPHYHTVYTETFTVLDGRLPQLYGDQKITAKPGDAIAIQPRTTHAWGPVCEAEATVFA